MSLVQLARRDQRQFLTMVSREQPTKPKTPWFAADPVIDTSKTNYLYAELAAEISERWMDGRPPTEEWAAKIGIPEPDAIDTLTLIDGTSLLEALAESEVEDLGEVRWILAETFATGWLAHRRWRNR